MVNSKTNLTSHIEILFSSSKSLEPNQDTLLLGKYTISTVPTAKESFTDSFENMVLEFDDTWDINQMYSNPEQEGNLVLSFLSLLFEAQVEHKATKVNNVQVTIERPRSANLRGKISLEPTIQNLFKKLQSMDSDLLRQFLRSCSIYQSALSLIEQNPTLSFFLLVTAIEAISGKIIRKGDRVNFREFIIRFLPKETQNEIGTDTILIKLIEECYRMRCAFTHGGSALSVGTSTADSAESPFVVHFVKGKKVFSPGLKWFEKVVRSTLINFLEQQLISKAEEGKLPSLSREDVVINLKLAKPLKSGAIVHKNDVDLNPTEKESIR